MDLWLACPNKAELIHVALNNIRDFNIPANSEPPVIIHKVEAKSEKWEPRAPAVIKTPKDAEKAVGKKINANWEGHKQLRDASLGRLPKLESNVKLCKIHGTPLDSRGKCLQKGCKYA